MKKFISLALALVMTLSLCTFIDTPKASADFEDADELSSKYAVQAADVIQKIEVMDGYDDGTFRPTAGLTRQAAAKIICNMILGPTTAKALPTNANPFPDVIAGNQFAGYISYCAQQGIISGYADGTFRGGDPLSGYAYLKMLLGALGYDAKHEGFVGDNWKVNVAKIALGIGLNKGIEEDLDGATQVTREAAAIYAFNTLQGDMVEYESKNTIEINGVSVSMGGGEAVPQTWNTSSTSADNINDARSDGNNARPIVQFAERYFDKLERDPKQWDTYTQDDFGRPSIIWTWKGVEIGTYSRDPDATFVGGVKVNEIYEALKDNTGMSSGSSSASLYVNSKRANRGYPTTTAAGVYLPYGGNPAGYGTFVVERANDRDLGDEIARNSSGANAGLTLAGAYDSTGGRTNAGGAIIGRNVDRIGDGTLIEAYRNEATNHVDVCVISVYGGKVDAVKSATTKKDAYVTISPSGDASKRPDSIYSASGNREYETEDFDVDDVVAYTYSDSAASIKSMYLLTPESGALQSKVMTKSLRLDGTTYNYAKEYAFDGDLQENNLGNKSSYIVYLDDNGYVLWVEEDEFSVSDFVLIERITIETTGQNAAGQKVVTKTASVLGTAEADAGFNGDNSFSNQRSYNQSKAAVGTSSWDAQAQVRYSNGARRTITLDDSKNYRTDDADDTTNYNVATLYYRDTANNPIQATQNGYSNYNSGTRTYSYVASGALVWWNPANHNDRQFAAVNPDPSTYVAAPVEEYGPFIDLTSGTTGDGDGNWIAEPFTAGHIVRVSSNSDGYRLHSINDTRYYVQPNFIIENNRIWNRTRNNNIIDNNGVNIIADSETHFVVEDVVQGTYKSYVGVKNAPDVHIPSATLDDGVTPNPAFGYNATAYIYHTNGSAKLIFVTSANDVSSSSNDIVFLAANSTSNLVESDDGFYYEVSAVEKNEVKTLLIKANVGVSFTVDGATFAPDNSSTQKKNQCVILNDVSTDSNDFITSGRFNVGKDEAKRTKGVRRVNEGEVRLGTATGWGNQLLDVAENVRVYFVDGDDIDEIGYDDIENDTMDWVYYIINSDGEVTYMFIVDSEDEDTAATASIPAANRTVTVGTNNYSIIPSSTTVAPGQTLTFRVQLGTAYKSGTQVAVTVNYVQDVAGSPTLALLASHGGDDDAVWTVTFPSDLKDGTTVSFNITEI